MKKILVLFTAAVLILASLVFPGCSSTSGKQEVITEKKDMTNFSTVEIGSAFDIDITYSETYSVTISADEDLFDYIEVTQTGTQLTIYLNPHHIFTDFTLGSRTLKAAITMPSLRGLVVSGACDGKVSGFHSPDSLTLNISGATKVNMDGNDTGSITGDISGASRLSGNLTATDVSLDVSGASSLSLKGSGTSLGLGVSGASNADLSGFTVDDADVTVSGASEATVYAENTLDVALSGASRLFFLGNPTMGQSSVTGASTIKHKD